MVKHQKVSKYYDQDCSHSKATSAQLGRILTYEKIAAGFFWYWTYNDVADYIQKYDRYQRQSSLPLNVKNEIHSVPVSLHIMKQVGLDLCSLPDVNGYRLLIVYFDYFTKWLEAKPIRDNTVLTVATFLYEVMFHHGCFEVQINDQGSNGVCICLHDLTGVEQHITIYHPQSNGLAEKHNRTIKNGLVKVLEANREGWPYIVEDVLFAHRVNRHSSTKYTPFF